MIAEIYAVDLDLVAAMEKLSLTGNSDIEGQVADGLEYARHINFTDQDIDIIGDLFDALDDYVNGEGPLP
jgi:hypothetical protein